MEEVQKSALLDFRMKNKVNIQTSYVVIDREFLLSQVSGLTQFFAPDRSRNTKIWQQTQMLYINQNLLNAFQTYRLKFSSAHAGDAIHPVLQKGVVWFMRLTRAHLLSCVFF